MLLYTREVPDKTALSEYNKSMGRGSSALNESSSSKILKARTKVTVTVKTCSGCDLEKNIEEFHYKSKEKGTRKAKCKKCSNEISKNHYQNNSESYNKRTTENSRKKRKENREKLAALKRELSCSICSKSGSLHSVIIEFHHRDPDMKVDSVSKLASTDCSWKKIQEEIDKCDITCGNCHAGITSKENNFWRSRPMVTDEEIKQVDAQRKLVPKLDKETATKEALEFFKIGPECVGKERAEWCSSCEKRFKHKIDQRARRTWSPLRDRVQRMRIQQEKYKILSASKCVDCGTEDWVSFQFDHVRGEKKFDIGAVDKVSLSSLRKEMAKCEIVCTDCHKIRTYERKK